MESSYKLFRLRNFRNIQHITAYRGNKNFLCGISLSFRKDFARDSNKWKNQRRRRRDAANF